VAQLGCANGGNGSSASGGDDGGTSAADVTTDAPTDAPPGEGGTSADQACTDDAASYCTQLGQCAAFLLKTQYGDAPTCNARRKMGCTDQVSAPGTGWTGDTLEACIKARAALSCDDFLHRKPAPTACQVTGAIVTSNACRYDAQCGTGYCRHTGGALCGNCVAQGATGAPCTVSADCAGDLVCAGSGTTGICEAPTGAGGPCDGTHPCAQGLACLPAPMSSMTVCVQPGDVGAPCNPANHNADCDYDKGAYCDSVSSTCLSYAVAMAGQACGGGTAACFGGGTCEAADGGTVCVPPVADGAACNPMQGASCMPPQSCQTGLCQLYGASKCM
jgi:hypothetical protein